jgi:hypothetical protein
MRSTSNHSRRQFLAQSAVVGTAARALSIAPSAVVPVLASETVEPKVYGSLRISAVARPANLEKKAVELITRTISERSGCRITQASDAQYLLTLATDVKIGAEGFRIERKSNSARIVGGDGRGLLYGVGRFLRDCRYAPTGILPGGWSGTRVPQLPVRGIYFATHFHNFYHDAPLAEVVRYVEELSLWGCNSLMVWFDMHHYRGINDPAVVLMIERLRAILRAANGVGMGVGILFLANEGYSSTPASVRVTPGPAQYNCEVCPSQPGGIDLILENRREFLERFADIDVEYFCMWPHDQGGCGCESCKPWGARGFVECIRHLNPMLSKMFPRARTIVSTWCFDTEGMKGEFEGLWRAIGKEPSLADFVMADAHSKFPPFVLEHGQPGGVPMLNFPEISMMGMFPWGGYGLNPLPQHIDRMWQASCHLMSGGFPYSEGIYEDVNKAIMLQLYWNPGRQVRDIIREYAAYEWSWEYAEALTNVAMRLGDGAQLRLIRGAHGELLPRDVPWYTLPTLDASQEDLSAIHRVEPSLTPYAQRSWRWRVFWLRVAIENELRGSNGKPTAQADSYFEELIDIYHARHALLCVTPPSAQVLRIRK